MRFNGALFDESKVVFLREVVAFVVGTTLKLLFAPHVENVPET